MPESFSKIYHISPGYRKVVIWSANAKTLKRVAVSTIKPTSKNRFERYTEIADSLREQAINPPPYEEKAL